MNTLQKTTFILILSIWCTTPAVAQMYEIQVLLLNVEKLRQFKEILHDMEKGYQILDEGYSTVKNIAQGNYSLHRLFLDGLMEVNPAVKNYSRVADIVRYQQLLMTEYAKANNHFKNNSHLAADEISYLTNVYSNLIAQSLQNLDDLLMVITASNLRMNDDERLHELDRIFYSLEDKLTFLRYFNRTTQLLIVQRAKEANDVLTIKKLHGLDN